MWRNIWLPVMMVFILTCLAAGLVNAQDTIPVPRSTSILPDSVRSLRPDTLRHMQARSERRSLTRDTIPAKQKGPVLDTKVDRTATDSIVQDLKNQKVYLYKNATITYGEIKIEADYIMIDFNTNEVFAKGVPDSTGKPKGNPVFTENGQKFEAYEMRYNFDTKKGLISKVVTEDGQGFLHGVQVKKMSDNSINIGSGSYTTCNNKEHPHFSFNFNKSKVIPDNKIVTGPAYMTIEDVPTPLAIPFGMFPNKSGQQSGIRIPTYGESKQRGFYLENGGYYFAINEHMDLDILGDIYSRGSWAIKPTLRYTKRYKFSGNFNASYATNIIGSKGTADYQKSNDFRIRWTHRQDPKARPAGRFSADVNIVSSNFSKYNPSSTENYLSNEFKSSIAYQTNFNNKLFLTINGSHRQNTKTKIVEVVLPEFTLSANSIYPLKKKNATGKAKWYESLSINYTTNARNTISLPDSLLFKPGSMKKLKNGIQHSIPISLPIKVLKYFSLSNSISLNDKMYFNSIKKTWVDTDPTDESVPHEGGDLNWIKSSGYSAINPENGYVDIDTIQGFRNVVDFSVSTNLSTKVYGMVKFKKGPIRAIRHVLTPSVGFSYTPAFGDAQWGYYDSYIDGNGETQYYSEFENGIYGSPTKDKSGRINFGLNNNLEIKVPSRKDTITGMKKVVLIEGLSLTGSYDLSKDSLNMSYISLSGRTKLFKNLNIQYSSIWDPYVVDSAGRQINRFEWNENRRLLRLNNTTWNFGFSWQLNQKDLTKSKEPKSSNMGTQQEIAEINQNPDDYVDWTVPWSLSINYNLRYSNKITNINWVSKNNSTVVQTLGFTGEVNITPKWKVGFNSGWDFKAKGLSYTSLNIYRDLHCWEMRFNWIPLGARASWNFSINVKASVLQDLKLNKKKDFRDL